MNAIFWMLIFNAINICNVARNRYAMTNYRGPLSSERFKKCQVRLARLVFLGRHHLVLASAKMTFFFWFFSDCLELRERKSGGKKNHLQPYIKCHVQQRSGTISIFHDVWLARRFEKQWPCQKWHWVCFALTQPWCEPRAAENRWGYCVHLQKYYY